MASVSATREAGRDGAAELPRTGEFDLIARHFSPPVRRAALGVGDDCALLNIDAGMQLAVSCDMLVEGRHFLSTVAPERLGHKALAVNLSDLAACGAEPLAFTLALAMPRADEAFVAPLAKGMLALAAEHGIELVGGDTTAGPLNLCITVFGEVPRGQALLRSGAQAGDDLWVSGTMGDARLALEVFRGHVVLGGAAFEQVRRAMELPQPRVALGQALRGLATSAIDSQRRPARRPGPCAAALGRGRARRGRRAAAQRRARARNRSRCSANACSSGGDDYELLFTAAPAARRAVRSGRRAAGRGGHPHRPHRAAERGPAR